jgi:hypothetical protein
VDVWTAQEDSAATLADDRLLECASQLRRPPVTHDIRLHALAENWQQTNRPFFGLIFGHLMQVSIGQCVRDLELIAEATDDKDW